MIIHSMHRDYFADFTKEPIIEKILPLENRFAIIDKKVMELYPQMLKPLLVSGRYYLLEAVEENKTIDKALEITDQIICLNTRKNTNLIAIGGGITQDVACFISSVLYRGIQWHLFPTTLLAQTDSCIGSKSSINYKQYKNLLGTFYPPSSIWIDTEFIKTLTQADYLSGLGEIFKIAIMRGKTDFYALQKELPQLLQRECTVLQSNTEKTLAFKKLLIEIDEFDRNERNILNYGHTFGHAIESVSNFGIPHGQGVALGITIANEISFKRGLLSNQYRKDVQKAMIQIITKDKLDMSYFEPSVMIPMMQKDKKYSGGLHTCILADENEVKKYTDITNEDVTEALAALRTLLRRELQ